MMPPADTETGNAFLEVLIALAITGLVLGALFDVLGDGAARARLAETKRAALVVAQSELAAAGTAYPLDDGPVNGVEGPFAWWIDATPYGPGPSEAGRLWAVSVQVSLQSGGPVVVQLRSLRLVPLH